MERVVRAIENFDLASPISYRLIHFASKASRDAAKEYLKKIKSKLIKGENVPIPEWYHATSAVNGEQIVKDGCLKSGLDAGRGPGIYFSTAVEQRFLMGVDGIAFGYSPCVLDETGIAGKYFEIEENATENNQYPATWLRLYDEKNEKNIVTLPLSKASVIAVNDPDSVSKRLIAQGIHVTVLNHETLNCVRNALEGANAHFSSDRTLPRKWKRHPGSIEFGTNINLPKEAI